MMLWLTLGLPAAYFGFGTYCAYLAHEPPRQPLYPHEWVKVATLWPLMFCLPRDFPPIDGGE